MSRLTARWRSRARRAGEQWSTWKGEWALERELEAAVAGNGPIIAGPWVSEVGYEVLYWVPFLRWVMAAYRVPPERVVAFSRGGTEPWYAGIASRYVEVFDHASPADLAARAHAGQLKQREVSDLDSQLIDAARRALGAPRAQVLHPSLLFRWFAPFWSGHETLGFVERHTRYTPMQGGEAPLPIELPRDYIAVKFYSARSLDGTPEVRDRLRTLVSALALTAPVVELETGLHVDDHSDYPVGGDRVVNVAGQFDARTNLGAQTRIIAGSRLFVGTCGSLAWLAPLLGVNTVPVFTDASFLHAHLHVARRVYTRVRGAGRFAPVDLSGLVDAGLTIDAAARLAGAPGVR